jgi:hypothetical protein
MGQVIDGMKCDHAGKKCVPDGRGVLLEIGKCRLNKIFEVLSEVFHGSFPVFPGQRRSGHHDIGKEISRRKTASVSGITSAAAYYRTLRRPGW